MVLCNCAGQQHWGFSTSPSCPRCKQGKACSPAQAFRTGSQAFGHVTDTVTIALAVTCQLLQPQLGVFFQHWASRWSS